jgi:ketosteroid isomerase-like protein
MKYLMILTVGFCLLFATVPAVADQAADEAAIREASKKAIETLNKGDVKGHADVYAEPFMLFGTKAQTRTAHEKVHNERIARSKDNPAQRKMLDDIGIVFLTADNAIHQYRLQTTGGIDEDGKEIPPVKSYIARVYMKQNGKWLIRAHFGTPIEE